MTPPVPPHGIPVWIDPYIPVGWSPLTDWSIQGFEIDFPDTSGSNTWAGATVDFSGYNQTPAPPPVLDPSGPDVRIQNAYTNALAGFNSSSLGGPTVPSAWRRNYDTSKWVGDTTAWTYTRTSTSSWLIRTFDRTLVLQVDGLFDWVIKISNGTLVLPTLPDGQIYQFQAGGPAGAPPVGGAPNSLYMYQIVDSAIVSIAAAEPSPANTADPVVKVYDQLGTAGGVQNALPATIAANTLKASIGVGSAGTITYGPTNFGTLTTSSPSTGANSRALWMLTDKMIAGVLTSADFPGGDPDSNGGLSSAIRQAMLTVGLNYVGHTPPYRILSMGAPPLRQRQNNRGNLGYPPLRASRQGSGIFPPLRQRQNAAR